MHPQVQADAPTFFCPSAPTANNSCSTISSSTSHSLAEKRRRQRINSHLSALKRHVPHSDNKMDKGSLLGCVVDHLKELKRSLVGEIIHQGSAIPNESDEIIVDHMTASTTTIGATNNNNNNGTGNSDCSNKGKYNEIYLMATVSCEDRPQLFMDLIDALKGLKMLRTIRTEIVTLGGRITLNIVLINIDNHESSSNINCLNSLKQSLRAVLGRVITPPSSSHWTSTSGFSSKRQRLLFPQRHSHFPW
ncbi:hypothetical protein C5167_016780 [Papaver somniferum]|uniref:transcription factor bHLH51-like n=1 Tax=Papaver somniferum TaxID=3469 RepID=UPI000E6F68A0|nr:transcription factor bHLH51-like [Papaver somniferum]RZC94086.1 hypothetical protein C5167_016780 [Papaver somniferum]